MKKNVLAIDLGASSGRVIIGKYNDRQLELEEIHRFANGPVPEDGKLRWDYKNLLEQILKGGRLACEKYEIDSLGIDTWGVDYGLLDAAGNLLETPVNYRDDRTKGILDKVAQEIDLKEIYQRTGNQLMEINTLFQLLTVKYQQPELLEQAKTLLFMPDLLNYLLTGEKAAEKSIASTSQLLSSETKDWDWTLIRKAGLPAKIFPELKSSGSFLGTVKAGLGVPPLKVYNICEHDTASAVVSVPCNQNFLFVSCGTWSLVGTELPAPIINEAAFRYNLTNELGINNTTRFLKNCTGLWIIQEVKRNLEALGRSYSYDDFTRLAAEARSFVCLLDTDDAVFAPPGDMIARIQEYARKTHQEVPQTDGEIIRCVYESLAMKYKLTFLEITDAAGQEFDTVNIVGGGSQSSLLCQMVANASNLRVSAGPVEATAIGNIAVQLMAEGVFDNLNQLREWVKQFSKVQFYFPTQEKENWDKQFSRYQELCGVRAAGLQQ